MRSLKLLSFLLFAIVVSSSIHAATGDEVGPATGADTSVSVEDQGVAYQPIDSEAIDSNSTSDLLPVASLDPAFDRYVDLSGVRAAIAAKDAVSVADVGMQLAEGEKVLLRIHKTGISASHLFGKAALIATTKQDKATLDRLSKAAEIMSDRALSDQLVSLQSNAGPSRSADPSLNVLLESMDVEQVMLIKSLLDTIEEAELVGDAVLLDSVASDLHDSGIPAEQKEAITKKIQAARVVIPENGDPLAALPTVSRDLLRSVVKQLQKEWRGTYNFPGRSIEKESALRDTENAMRLLATSLDPAFDRYVDLTGVRASIAARDASALTDVGLQLAEGEKVLLRTHRSRVSASHLLGKSALIALVTQDKITLERLGKAAYKLGDKALSEQVASLQLRAGASRSAEPTLTLSLESMDAEHVMLINHLLDSIQEAELVEDVVLLDSVEADLVDSGISAEQKDAILKKIAAARAVIPKDGGPLAALQGASREWLLQHDYRSMQVDLISEGRLVRRNSRGVAMFPELGSQYQIKISNLGSSRVLAVISVDGLSVMNRKPAAPGDGGYILNPRSSAVIPGWRLDSARVAAFVVSPPQASAAAEYGLASSVGQIAVTLFAEEPPPVALRKPTMSLRPSFGGIGNSLQSSKTGNAGTAAGQQVDFQTTSTSFRRGRRLGIQIIRYQVGDAPGSRGTPQNDLTGFGVK